MKKKQVPEIKPKSASELKSEITQQCEKDPLFFGLLTLPKHFKKPSPRFHADIVDLCEKQFVVIAAPRKFAKSTLISLMFLLHRIVFKKCKFIVIIQNTFTKAAATLDNIKSELKINPVFQTMKITISKDAAGDSEFKHPDGFEIKILCKGIDQIGSLRGVKFREQRPDLILGDDMEDDELVRNPERRIQLEEEFDDVVVPLGDETTKHLYIGTILHDDSQLSKLLNHEKYGKYERRIFRALDKEDNSIWEEGAPTTELHEERRLNPFSFAKEKMNDPVSGKNVRFKKEDFRYYKIQDSKYICMEGTDIITSGHLSDCKASIACDLAWKEKRDSDDSVILPAFLTPDNLLLVDNYICKKGMRPEELCEQLFVMEERLRGLTGSVVEIGFERAMLENVVQYILKKKMQETGHYLLTKELLWDADKITRIETRLQPRYAQHVIFHKQGMGELEHQLTRFPSGAHDDLVDALQGVVQLLQYPRHKSKIVATDGDMFMYVRKRLVDSKMRTAKITGNKHRDLIPSTTAWL